MATEQELYASLEDLNKAIDRSNAEKDQLRERLRLIERIALNHIGGDSASDQALGEIVGVAEGDPNWLRHAKINYEMDRAKLVRAARTMVEDFIEHFPEEGIPEEAAKQYAAEALADQIEQELLPMLFMAEDGRTFLRGTGQPYPRPATDRRAFEPSEDQACPKCGSSAWKYEGDRQMCADCGA